MLKTVDLVVQALGGPDATAEKVGLGVTAIHNWKSRKKIGPENFLIVVRELSRLGYQVDPLLFGFKKPRENVK